jgi:hypothetical protein
MLSNAHMDYEKIAVAIAEDLRKVSRSLPNERLPKEEQIRSCMYAELRPLFEVVCVERGYSPIDSKSSIEIDICARDRTGQRYWIEIKRCWHVSGRGWVHKPDEQLCTWQADIDKLAKVSTEDVRVFVLVGCLAADPMSNPLAIQSGVLKRMTDFYPTQLRHYSIVPFTWRESPISHLSIAMWEWKRGEAI